MEIANARVASFHYTLTDDAGAVLDKSPDGQPLQYLHGAGNIVPGLEQAMAGRKVGDAFDVTVQPEDAYGVRNEQLIQSVPREAFQGVDTIEAGMQFTAQGPGGAMMVTVVEADDSQVRIDGNHPLAGRTLHFAVRIDGVRDATAEEQAAGRTDTQPD